MPGQREARCVGGSYYLRDKKTAIQRTVNMYPMAVEGVGEDVTLVLESAPGLKLVADLGDTIRGIYNADGRFFIVAGATLQELNADGTLTVRGAVTGGSDAASMVNGTGQLAVVCGNTLHVLNLDTNTLTIVVSEAWLGSVSVGFIDGYFTFIQPGSENFYISAVDDATSLDGIDVSNADSQPDAIVGQIVRKRELYLFGSRTCEPWINSGDPDFPFSRYQGTPIDVGLAGPRAVTRAADTIVWIGQTDRGGPYVYRMNGFQPVRISTQAVEQQLALSTDYTQATCWAYQEAGAEFVGINAPGMPSTWVWDAATEQWHERAEFENGSYSRSRVEYTAFFGGQLYAAGGSKLYTMSREYHDLAGTPMMRERTWPHFLTQSLEPRSYPGIEVRCTSGSGTAATMSLQISNDGGYLFGSSLQRSLGAVGRRQQRVRWTGLGTCPAGGSRVFRLRCLDSVPLVIHGATVT